MEGELKNSGGLFCQLSVAEAKQLSPAVLAYVEMRFTSFMCAVG